MIRADLSAFMPRFARLDYYTTSSTVCQEVFEKFFKFFSKTFSTAFQPERKCLSIIPHPLAFVKRFFKSFFNFFQGIFRSSPLSQFPALKRLAYYSTFISFCQQVFAKFFEFGASGRFAQTKGKTLVQLAQQMSILVPNRGMLGVCNAHFPRLQPLHAAIRVLNHDAHAPRGRSVHHEGLDELIIHI